MNIAWDRLGAGLFAGRYNLLLGAGVSLDSSSRSLDPLHRGHLPSAGKLRNDLASLVPKVREGSSLNRVYRSLSNEQIEQHITARFSNCLPGDTVKAIARFRWRRIFTLNVDDAIENAYGASPIKVQKPVSLNYTDDYVDYQDRSIVPIIHLHGYAQRPEDGYVFDIKTYMRAISDNNLWAHVLGNFIRSEPFIVLGTSLEEPDIAYFLSERDQAKTREDRPPSILVEPFPDDGTARDCEEYALALYEAKALDFLSELDRRFPTRPSVLDSVRENLGSLADGSLDVEILSVFHSDFQRVPDAEPDEPDRGPSFALGHPASWTDIFKERDIPRAETNEVHALYNEAKPEDVCLLLGDAGAGKSTVLRRLAMELAGSEIVCFWCRAIGRIRVDVAVSFIKSLGDIQVVIFVDNFGDHVTEIEAMRRFTEGSNVKFVGAERYYRFEHVKRVMGRRKIRFARINKLGADGAVRLVEHYRALGLSTARETKAAPSAFAAKIADDPIAVACCRILNNFDPLEQIIDRSFADASTKARQCYLLVALASHCFREGIQYDILSQIMRGYDIERQVEASGPLPIDFRDQGDLEMIVPLNEAISSSILRRSNTRVPEDVYWSFIEIAKGIRPYVNLRSLGSGHPSARLASRLFDYDEVVRDFLGPDGAAQFYEEIAPLWSWNSRYWHQIALMRLDLAEHSESTEERERLCDLAVQHARHAGTIEPNHPFTLTTLGKVLFGKMHILSRANPTDLDEAIKALAKAVRFERERRRISVHPFMVLFRGVNNSAEYKAVYSHDQRRELLSLARQAKAEFANDAELAVEAEAVITLAK